jgi:ankyrin repeat protein
VQQLDGGRGYAGSEDLSTFFGAARRGELDTIKSCAEREPVLLEMRGDKDEETLLICASESGSVELVRWVLDQGAAVDEVDGQERTALVSAIKARHADVVALLMERGANPSVPGNGSTPLIAAYEAKDGETVDCLLGHPLVAGFINLRDSGGKTMLFKAYERGDAAMVARLLGSGADPTVAGRRGKTCLMAAIEQDYRQRRGWGDDVEEEDTDSEDQLGLARGRDQREPAESVRCLLNHACVADFINLQDNDQKTALYKACEAGDIPLATLLLEKGADPALADSHGITPLMVAMPTNALLHRRSYDEYGDTDDDSDAFVKDQMTIVRLLLSRANVTDFINLQDRLGETALFKACDPDKASDVGESSEEDQPKALAMMLLSKAGCRPGHRRHLGRNPLDDCVLPRTERSRTRCAHPRPPPRCRFINLQDKNGKTPLHSALHRGGSGLLKLMLEKGADPTVVDKEKYKHKPNYYKMLKVGCSLVPVSPCFPPLLPPSLALTRGFLSCGGGQEAEDAFQGRRKKAKTKSG